MGTWRLGYPEGVVDVTHELYSEIQNDDEDFSRYSVYLTPPDGITELKAKTNSLEGGVNAGIKKLLYDHRGLPEGHQRVICDWWLYLHTHLPDDPEKIARQQHWGQAGLAKAQAIITQEHEATYGNADGRPATYDTAIDSTPTNSIGIRKGWAGRN